MRGYKIIVEGRGREGKEGSESFQSVSRFWSDIVTTRFYYIQRVKLTNIYKDTVYKELFAIGNTININKKEKLQQK